MKGSIDRNKRVRRLKKMIVCSLTAAVMIPVIVCVILLVYVCRLKGELLDLKAKLPSSQEVPVEESGIFTTASVEEYVGDDIGTVQTMKNSAQNEAERQIYLTFDDGPSSNTDEILDILKQYNVKATFFVVGKTDETSVKAYRRIVEEGHTLGMHSYSHKYQEIYRSLYSFSADLQKLQEYLYQITGVWPRIYRFPGGSSNTVSQVDMQELITYLNDNDITYMDWNIASGDAISGYISKDNIVTNCLSQIDNLHECVILMHDTSQKNTTVEALPEIIEQVKERGDTVFLPITDGTTPIRHISVDQ